MPLIRCTNQSYQTLEEKYSEFFNGKITATWTIIEIIDKLFENTIIYCFTSMYRLYLVPRDDDYTSPWYVGFGGATEDYIWVDFHKPESTPWKDARITGEAHSIEEAVKYIVIAMYESKGWENNKELEKLYEQYHV